MLAPSDAGRLNARMLLRILLACALLGLAACAHKAPPAHASTPPPTHNSANSLDWAGSYEGTTPCADCPGIQTIVQLRSNGTYVLTERYLEREVAPRTQLGRFAWDAAGRDIALDVPGGPRYYRVGENQLQQLDRDGRPNAGPNASAYVLRKRPGAPPGDPSVQLDGRWALFELAGEPVAIAGPRERAAELRFDRLAGRVSGFTGCNNISGGFSAGPADRLQLQQLASTRRACIGPNVEAALLRALEQVSRYAVNGHELLLLPQSGDQPLARFRLAATP